MRGIDGVSERVLYDDDKCVRACVWVCVCVCT